MGHSHLGTNGQELIHRGLFEDVGDFGLCKRQGPPRTMYQDFSCSASTRRLGEIADDSPALFLILGSFAEPSVTVRLRLVNWNHWGLTWL